MFTTLNVTDARSRLSTATEKLETQITEFDKKLEGLSDEMGALKKHLYSKFGKAINLERD